MTSLFITVHKHLECISQCIINSLPFLEKICQRLVRETLKNKGWPLMIVPKFSHGIITLSHKQLRDFIYCEISCFMTLNCIVAISLWDQDAYLFRTVLLKKKESGPGRDRCQAVTQFWQQHMFNSKASLELEWHLESLDQGTVWPWARG